jgi:hypothetical protein
MSIDETGHDHLACGIHFLAVSNQGKLSRNLLRPPHPEDSPLLHGSRSILDYPQPRFLPKGRRKGEEFSSVSEDQRKFLESYEVPWARLVGKDHANDSTASAILKEPTVQNEISG